MTAQLTVGGDDLALTPAAVVARDDVAEAAEVEAPATVGSDRHPPLEPAPGAYVLDRVP